MKPHTRTENRADQLVGITDMVFGIHRGYHFVGFTEMIHGIEKKENPLQLSLLPPESESELNKPQISLTEPLSPIEVYSDTKTRTSATPETNKPPKTANHPPIIHPITPHNPL
jgi:hypothetical protein